MPTISWVFGAALAKDSLLPSRPANPSRQLLQMAHVRAAWHECNSLWEDNNWPRDIKCQLHCRGAMCFIFFFRIFLSKFHGVLWMLWCIHAVVLWVVHSKDPMPALMLIVDGFDIHTFLSQKHCIVCCFYRPSSCID